MGTLKIGDRVKTTDGLEGVLVDRSALTPGQWWVTIGRCTARFDEDALTPLDEVTAERVWPKCTAAHRCSWQDGLVGDAICTHSLPGWKCRFMASADHVPHPPPLPPKDSGWHLAEIRRPFGGNTYVMDATGAMVEPVEIRWRTE